MVSAFLKARTWAWEQPYYDTVELKLFEWKFDENIEYIANRLGSDYQFQPLTGYLLPKDVSASRKFSYRNFIDEVGSVAVSLGVGIAIERQMDRGGRVSFGNRLDLSRESDRLFIPWEKAWNGLSDSCRRAAHHSPYFIRTDVRQFYPEIPLDRLERTLRDIIPGDDCTNFFRALIRVQCPFMKEGCGLPAGPAISGFIANIYLLPLDGKIKFQWKAKSRFRRYVDDIFFFSRTRPGARRALNSLKKEVSSNFGLSLHTGKKLEVGYSRNPLRRGSPPHSWRKAEELFDSVFGSIYRLDRRLWKRFINEPDHFLKWYSRGLRWCGIYVSTDWLAQRLLTIKSRGLRSRWLTTGRTFRLRYPDLELYGIEKRGTRDWAVEFQKLNPRFFGEVLRLDSWMKRLTIEAYNNLGDVRRQNKDELKGRIFALRNFAGRMAQLNCRDVSFVYNMLVDHPWILDPATTVNAFLSYGDPYSRLRQILESPRPEIVRAKAAWALGELGNPRAVRPLWEAGVHGYGEVAKRSALESLLRLDRWGDIPDDWIYGEAENQSNPALRKFFYLMLGRKWPVGVEEFFSKRSAHENDHYCRLALEYAAGESQSLFHVKNRPRHLDDPVPTASIGHPAERR